MYDAIVIGARCAGAATAMLLARQGHNVLLVDRAAVGSEIPHGHFIHRGGPQRLQKWGLWDKVVATGAPPVHKVNMVIGGAPLATDDLYLGGIPFGLAPRRAAIDRVLAEAAVAAGVELRDRFLVETILRDGERVTGIRGRDLATGETESFRATIVIGADGRNSRLAQAVEAPVYEAVPSVSCYYFSYWRGIPFDRLEMHIGMDQVIFAFPTNDDQLALFIAWPIEKFPEVRQDIEGHFMAALAQAPELATQVAAGERVERFYGTADLPNFFRKPFGPGWALVGDAGHHKDPFMALGMGDALRDAELVAVAVHAGLLEEKPLLAALADYETQRNEESMPIYYENLNRARFVPPPAEMRQLRAALIANGDQADIDMFYKATLGLLPLAAFFNPDNIGRIMARQAASMAA
ncbi:MAG: FAD-dependent monooxygenase [Anaerolineales bacterium]|nr:FAD-dependent monooxygenase [Anaerolineales bacterium]